MAGTEANNGTEDDGSAPMAAFYPDAIATSMVAAKTAGKISKGLTKSVASTARTVTQTSVRAAAAKTKAAQSLARAESSSGFFGRINQWFAARDANSAAKLAAKVTKTEATAARVAGVEASVGTGAKLVGKLGWIAAAGLAVKDIYDGYKQHGWSGAASAAIDAATVTVPSMLAADAGAGVGAAIGTFIFPGVGTVVGGLIGGVAAGWFAGDFAQKNLLPAARGLESMLGLPTPNTPPGTQTTTSQGNGSQSTGPDANSTGQPDPTQTQPDPALAAANAPPMTASPQALAAASNGTALFNAGYVDFTKDEAAALLAADQKMLHQMADARKTRSHAKINIGGQDVDFDGSKDGPIALEVDGHVDRLTGSKESLTVQGLRAENAAAILKLAAKEEGMSDAVTVTAKADGLGQGDTADQRRNSTIKLVGASM